MKGHLRRWTIKLPIDFYLFILLKDIFNYYIIILPLFGYKRGYGMTERSEFILTEIKGYYNANDRWKFIFIF